VTVALALREGRALGSPLRLLVGGRVPASRLDAAWEAVAQEFDAVDRAMSRFREDSEITALHRAAERGDPAARVSPRLRAALDLADRARRVTSGRFDAGVLVDLERLGSVGVRQAWPAAAPRHAPRAHELAHDGGVRLLAPVDLGGLGKGLALRWATRGAAAALDGQPFLIDAGGDIVARGGPDGGPWSIAIEDPTGGPEPLATVSLPPDAAIATSSVRIATWLGPAGERVHHLIDPTTHAPGGAGRRSVTVLGADPAWAEIWSKALFLESALEIGPVARRRGLAAWWVDADGSVSMTPAARLRTTWLRSEPLLAVV
jgi:FAD:protein FMN transferase